MKMYMTKYALSNGIEEVDASESSDPRYVRVDGVFGSLRLGMDIFVLVEDAIKDAEEKRIKKIASLNKQIKKLEKLNFGK